MSLGSRFFHVANHNPRPPVRLGLEPVLSPSAEVIDCRFGRYTEVDDLVRMRDCVVDDYAYLQRLCEVASTDIGKFANIAAAVRINPGFHPMERPSLHHFTYRRSNYGEFEDDDEFFAWRRRQRVKIGHDTWIGHGVVIMPSVRIGNGAVIGSNSVVTHDVPAYAIAAGVPAKVIRMRFPAAIAQAIEATGWWHWDHDTLMSRLDDFMDLRRFLARHAG